MEFFKTLKKFGKSGKKIEKEVYEDQTLISIAYRVSPEAVDLLDIVFDEVLSKILNSDEYQERSKSQAEVKALKREIDSREETEKILRDENATLKRENLEIEEKCRVMNRFLSKHNLQRKFIEEKNKGNFRC
ncbi:MAG TPA: hypothetical protein DEP37_15450 [Algoriphagus sp.]|nr:hypothetical protein [Algoriphagus sp.]